MNRCVYTCECMSVCIYTDVYVSIYTMCVCTDMSVRVCGSMCIYIGVCIYQMVCVGVYAYTQMYVCVYECVCL